MFLLILYVTLAIGVSFLCSILEAVLLSVTPAWIATLEERGHRAAEALAELKSDVDRPLAAILSLNTIAHTVGAAGAGAQAAVVFGDAAVGVFSAILTLLILVLSEIIPKTLGAVYWRPLSRFLPMVLKPMVLGLYPLVIVSRGLTRMLSRGKPEAAVSREEFAALAELGEREGAIDADESRVMSNLMRFRTLRVRDVMTPRTVVSAVTLDTTVGELVDNHELLRFSRLPVYGHDGDDDVRGYVLKDAVLLAAARDEQYKRLEDLLRPIEVLPDSTTLASALDRLLSNGEHIALVVNEFGGMAGVVSLEDIVETLLGLEIVDELDAVEDMQALARAKWRERAERLGIAVSEEFDPDTAGAQKDAAEAGSRERDAIIEGGLTGGEPGAAAPGHGESR